MRIWQAFKQLSERVQMFIIGALLILMLAIIAAIVFDRQAAGDITGLLWTVAAVVGGLGGYGISRRVRLHADDSLDFHTVEQDNQHKH